MKLTKTFVTTTVSLLTTMSVTSVLSPAQAISFQDYSKNDEVISSSIVASLVPAIKCFNVSSRQRWQHFELGLPGDPRAGADPGFTYIESISGSWSVDYRRYRYVGAEGHFEPGLEPYNHYKYSQNFPFGALFVNIPNYGYIHVKGPMRLPMPIQSTDMRINDADIALGDNQGELKVCFSGYPGL